MELISREQVIATIDSFNVFESRSDQIKLELMIGELPIAGVGTNLAEVGTDAVSREAVKELAYSQIRSMYCGAALKEQRETMLRIADNVIGLLAPVATKQPEIVRCKDCKYARLTDDGSCKYCDIWFPDEAEYMDGDYYCASAERKSNG